MKNLLILASLIFFTFTAVEAQNLPLVETFRYESEVYNSAAVQAHAYDPVFRKIYIADNNSDQLLIFDAADVTKIGQRGQVDLSTYGLNVSDVAAYGNAIAVCFINSFTQSAGKLIFFNRNGDFLNQLNLGAKPKSMRFANNGQYLIITNEGVPSDDYNTDPLGTISVVSLLSATPDVLTQNSVSTIDFQKLDTTTFDSKIRVFGNDFQQSPSEDIEPEGIAIDEANNKAYISLQENNAIAVIDYFFQNLDTVHGLPVKNLGLSGKGLDASDQRSTINIDTYNRLSSFYQPAGLAHFQHSGTGYLATANQGAARDYSAYSEVERVRFIPLTSTAFPNRGQLQEDTVLGRLQITTTRGQNAGGFVYDSLFTFGGRSYSIWNENGQLIWDSGDEFEQTLAQLEPANFNSSATSNQSFKAQSDNQGPEPNAVAVGEIDGTRYAFITLRQMGGIMIYNINDPANPVFESYLLNRDFSKATNSNDAGDLGPSKITFVPASASSNGIALIMLSNEVSGSFTLYQVGQGINLPEEELLPNMAVYPNPSSGIFHTQSLEPLKVYNMQGALVMEVDRQEDIDLTKMPNGYYMVKDNNGKAFKILKK